MSQGSERLPWEMWGFSFMAFLMLKYGAEASAVVPGIIAIRYAVEYAIRASRTDK